MTKRKIAFHLVGLSTLLVCACWVLLMFVGIAIAGKVTIIEPNYIILATELGLFTFTTIYASYLLKTSYMGLLRKAVWDSQRRNYYEN